MDARDRLRRYLEQRRELGESEFVLDGLPVEEVLKLVGMKSRGAAQPRAEGAPPSPIIEAPREPRRAPGPPPAAGGVPQDTWPGRART